MVSPTAMSACVTTAVLLVTVCCNGIHSQLVATVTDPPTTDANPAVVAAAENATNVTMYCEVTRGGSVRQNFWFLGGSQNVINFHFTSSGGTGASGFENFFITYGKSFEGTPLRTNLTIRVFNRTFDMARISCGSGNDIAMDGTFILRIISEYQ